MTVFRWIIGIVAAIFGTGSVIAFVVFITADIDVWLERARAWRRLAGGGVAVLVQRGDLAPRWPRDHPLDLVLVITASRWFPEAGGSSPFPKAQEVKHVRQVRRGEVAQRVVTALDEFDVAPRVAS